MYVRYSQNMTQLDSNENMLQHGFIVKNYLYIAVVRRIIPQNITKLNYIENHIYIELQTATL